MVIKQNVPHGMDDPGFRRKDIVMIKLHDIQKDYGTVPVLENISLEIIPGKIYGLVGPNGAGKTTFLKILAGILYPASGSLEIQGSQEKYDRWCRTHVIYIPGGDRGLRQKNSVYENALCYGIIKGMRKQAVADRILELAPVLSMEKLLDKRVETLSMGQKKKAALLCGLCSGMQVILFDEPSLGVDIDGIEELKSIIKKVHQEYQITFLISSHDMSFLSDIASEYIFMSGGRIKLEHHGPADHKDIMKKYQKLIR